MSRITINTQMQLDDEIITEGGSDEIQQKIMKIVTMLPEHCQNAFYLTTVHGLSDVEASQFLNDRAENIRSYINEAVIWIRENVGKIRLEVEQ